MVSKSKEQCDKSDEMLRIAKELLWRDIFVDTVKGYTWYHAQSLSLGRWAIGYNYAYVLARVLDEFRPTNILECGLGQSSKIITEYVSANTDVNCDIVEQDQNWVEFFKRNYRPNNRTNIYVKNIVEIDFPVEEGYHVKAYMYEEFTQIVEEKSYALISIDGPWGSNPYSRVDVIGHIPEILQEEFVIMVDDFERVGERNMVGILKKKLDENQIKYYEGKYVGMKDVCVIVSEKWKFLTTM